MFLKDTESLKRSILVDPGKSLAVTCELNLRHTDASRALAIESKHVLVKVVP